MQFPILIGLRRSFLARAGLLACTLPGLAAPFLTAWPLPVGAALGLAGLIYSLYSWHMLNCQPVALLVEKSGRLALRPTVDDGFIDVEQARPLFIHPWLIVIRYRLMASGRRRSLALFADSMDGESHRRLRVCLRLLLVTGDQFR